MSETFSPELGQMCFGNAWGEHDMGELGDACMTHVLAELDHVYWNREQRARDAGAPCEIGGVVYRPYYWGDCQCGHADEEWAWAGAHPHAPDCYWTAHAALTEQLHAAGARMGTPAWAVPVRALCDKHGIPWNDGRGSAVHCTCGRDKAWAEWATSHDHKPDCGTVLPNLELRGHEPVTQIRWYKHPGRSMTVNRAMTPADWNAWLNACIEAIRKEDAQ